MITLKDAFADQVAVVTGASRGIGKAIALELAGHGATLCLVGRDRDAFTPVSDSVGTVRSSHIFVADLADTGDVQKVGRAITQELGRVDILVHSAGAYGRGALRDASVDQLDLLYKVNVRASYLLTQLLLPLLAARRGQIVFLNSSQGVKAAAHVGQYAATQHALKAVADSLRQEVNSDGVRVLSVYPGRTATPRMESIYLSENRPYKPELLLQPEDVAAVIVNALTLPRTAEVTDIHVRPLTKSY